MKIYLAARYTRGPEMREIAARLSDMGHSVTSRWILGDHDWCGVCTKRAKQISDDDIEDLKAANLVVVFTPGGRRGGSHFEHGLAVGLGKAVFVVGPRQNVFHLIENRWFCTPADLLEFFEATRIEAGALK